jgi:hypothetical protein
MQIKKGEGAHRSFSLFLFCRGCSSDFERHPDRLKSFLHSPGSLKVAPRQAGV